MGFFDNFFDGLNSETEDKYRVGGIQVRCSHCGGVNFERSEAQLNTAGLTFLDLDWANRSADVLICKTCGHIEWFLDDGDLECI